MWDSKGASFLWLGHWFLQTEMLMSLGSATTHSRPYQEPCWCQQASVGWKIAGEGEPGEGNWPGHGMLSHGKKQSVADPKGP